jgi:hypothetical protein
MTMTPKADVAFARPTTGRDEADTMTPEADVTLAHSTTGRDEADR